MAAVAIGFSLLLYEGGSVQGLADCARSRNVTALYAVDNGGFVPYILGAPEFVNREFRELFAAGVPAITPLVTTSAGPASEDPASGNTLSSTWSECLRGDIAVGFSLLLYEGGSVRDLVDCARSRNVTALYAVDGGGFVPHILGAPEFVNRAFSQMYAAGLFPATPLIAKSDGETPADAGRDGGATN